MKIEEQKKAVRSGYDMDIIPTDISTYGEDVEDCSMKSSPGMRNF